MKKSQSSEFLLSEYHPNIEDIDCCILVIWKRGQFNWSGIAGVSKSSYTLLTSKNPTSVHQLTSALKTMTSKCGG
ncbi:hypothetical protein TNCV_696411 [Trichonephila clavipes]|nr:hypothetical protein TNCV_696411 [Trichonephila clavipes]